jgi:DNA invertase Pin-like site-specific DNA recombinase
VATNGLKFVGRSRLAASSGFYKNKRLTRDLPDHPHFASQIELPHPLPATRSRAVTFDRARIVSLRKEGMGATEIAKAVGCKRGNVYKTLKATGLN